MKKVIFRILFGAALLAFLAFTCFALFIHAIHYRRTKLIEELGMSPRKQADTIWKTEEGDIFFITEGDPLESGNFYVYVLWEDQYREAGFSCDLGRTAILALPDSNGNTPSIVTEDMDAVYLAVGTYHFTEDTVLLDDFSEESSEKFLNGRDSIYVYRFPYEELIDSLPFAYP